MVPGNNITEQMVPCGSVVETDLENKVHQVQMDHIYYKMPLSHEVEITTTTTDKDTTENTATKSSVENTDLIASILEEVGITSEDACCEMSSNSEDSFTELLQELQDFVDDNNKQESTTNQPMLQSYQTNDQSYQPATELIGQSPELTSQSPELISRSPELSSQSHQLSGFINEYTEATKKSSKQNEISQTGLAEYPFDMLSNNENSSVDTLSSDSSMPSPDNITSSDTILPASSPLNFDFENSLLYTSDEEIKNSPVVEKKTSYVTPSPGSSTDWMTDDDPWQDCFGELFPTLSF